MRFHFSHCRPRDRSGEGFFAGRGWQGFGPGFSDAGDFPFGGHRGGRGRGGGGGGRGRRRMFGSGELRLVLLRLIADEPRHGYDLIRAIEELTGGDYAPSPGVIYPTLTLLQDMGLIEEQASEGARKAYAATDAGTAHLAEHEDEVASLLARLDAARPAETETGYRPIHRAMNNLREAMRNRVRGDGWSEKAVHEVTAILDEAAQRIERLGS